MSMSDEDLCACVDNMLRLHLEPIGIIKFIRAETGEGLKDSRGFFLSRKVWINRESFFKWQESIA
jgi:hypothetical protein